MTVKQRIAQLTKLFEELNECDVDELKEAHEEFDTFEANMEEMNVFVSYYAKAKFLKVGSEVSILHSMHAEYLDEKVTYFPFIPATIIGEPNYDMYAAVWEVPIKINETGEEVDVVPSDLFGI